MSAPVSLERPSTRARIGSASSLAELVDAARLGDEHAWTALVRRLDARLRGTVRPYGLSAAQVDDVLQVAWLKLFEHLGALRSSEAVGAWLVVTVRREAFRVLQGRVREVVTDDPRAGHVDRADGPEAQALAAESSRVLARAVGELPDRHRRLMDLMLREPGLDYREVSDRTGIPVGSIGPIRGRCVARMARDHAVQSLRD